MISIYFLPEATALQYVIHNAGNNIHATIYLKREQEYFEWESGAGAYGFWNEVRKARGALTPQPPKAMFFFVPEFNLYHDDFDRGRSSEALSQKTGHKLKQVIVPATSRTKWLRKWTRFSTRGGGKLLDCKFQILRGRAGHIKPTEMFAISVAYRMMETNKLYVQV